MMNYDAFARLNIARKIIDNLTPGIGQLGAIWPPLPQLFFLPLIWNDFLWHSGLAGTFVSTTSFVVSAIYLEKLAFMLTKSLKASLIVWFIFVTNINLLLFQTTPMSEAFFLCVTILVLYFLTKWSLSQNMLELVIAAIFVMAATLTRYEGYFIFLGSLLTVFAVLAVKNGRKNFAEVEGTFILYLTISIYGIFLWCIYCAIFFKDPLAWLHFYSYDQSVPSLTSLIVTHKNSFFGSLLTYGQAIIWMNGILISLVGILGYPVLLFSAKSKFNKNKIKSLKFLPLLIIGTVLMFLLIFGYYIGWIPSIYTPQINLQNIFNKSLNDFFDKWQAPNIRYGLISMPFLALFAGFAVGKSRLIAVVVFLLILGQLFTNFYTPLYLQFSIPETAKFIHINPAIWLKSHYDEGLILVGSGRHEDLIFQTGLNYNHFIHEGTKNIWRESLDDPSRYARWIIFNDRINEDRLPGLLSENAYEVIEHQFLLVYEDDLGYKIFKKI